MGAVERRRRNRFPGVVEYELTRAGHDLVSVAVVLGRWLEGSPDGALELGSGGAKAAVEALAEAWTTTMLRALAAAPLSLTELDGVIAALNYPSLERRLSGLRLAGLVEPMSDGGRGTPYRVTPWLRRGMAPLVAAMRWERAHLRRRTAQPARIDFETIFLLTLPLAPLPGDLSGGCRIAVELPDGGEPRLACVVAVADGGRTVGFSTDLRGHMDAWAIGPPSAWLDATVLGDLSRIRSAATAGSPAPTPQAFTRRSVDHASSPPLDLGNMIGEDGSK